MADIGLFSMRIQEDGETVETVDIGVGDSIGKGPSLADWIQQHVPANEVPDAIAPLVEAFAECRDPGRTFREWADAGGTETVVEYRVPEETELETPYIHDAKQSWYPFTEDKAQSEQAVTSN